ncbi:MAG: DUF177 domain-containing protein [Candidatus Gracilibacteria bacterium]|jgi:uncharacterized protein
MNDIFIFDVAAFENKPDGTRETYTFKGKAEFEDFKTYSDFEGKVEIMKLDDALNVYIQEGTVKMGFVCEKCTKPFKTVIDFSKTERQFYFKRPQQVEDLNDLYLIDTKHMKIDISEMVRQEIILHFPLNLVCSSRCKGLCTVCGGDKNKKTCKCKPADGIENKPLKILKELIKN